MVEIGPKPDNHMKHQANSQEQRYRSEVYHPDTGELYDVEWSEHNMLSTSPTIIIHSFTNAHTRRSDARPKGLTALLERRGSQIRAAIH